MSVLTNSRIRKPLWHFATAIVFTGLALLLRGLIDPWVGDYLPLTTLYGSVAATVWLGGYRPALFAMVLGYLGADWLFIQPRYDLGPTNVRDVFGLLAYLFSCGLIIAFGEALRAARRQAVESQNEAQARQAELENEAAERKRAEEQAQSYLADLWRMGRIRTADQTALSLAHELNQPLTAIALQAGIASSLAQTSGVPLSPDLTSALREIGEQSHRSGRIIRAMRDLVRRGTTRREPVQLNEVVHEVVQLVEALVRQHKAEIELMLDDLPLVNADRIQIAQVLMNLLQNALDAFQESEPEHRSIEISTRVNAATNSVEAAVRDSGPGMPPEIAERVFERFYTTKIDGIGLGLAIAHSIVEAHEGKLLLERTGPYGTTFRFCLPIPGPAAAV